MDTGIHWELVGNLSIHPYYALSAIVENVGELQWEDECVQGVPQCQSSNWAEGGFQITKGDIKMAILAVLPELIDEEPKSGNLIEGKGMYLLAMEHLYLVWMVGLWRWLISVDWVDLEA